MNLRSQNFYLMMCFRSMLTFMLLSCDATAYLKKKMNVLQHAVSLLCFFVNSVDGFAVFLIYSVFYLYLLCRHKWLFGC